MYLGSNWPPANLVLMLTIWEEEEAEALGVAGAQVFYGADVVGSVILTAIGDVPGKLLLQPQLHTGVTSDKGKCENYHVADGVHDGRNVVHDRGFDILSQPYKSLLLSVLHGLPLRLLTYFYKIYTTHLYLLNPLP